MAVLVEWHGNEILKGIDRTNKKLVRCIALTISRKAKLNLYPGHGLKTSNLKRSIRAVVKEDKAEVWAGGEMGCAPAVSSPVGYAAYVELGTFKMAAKPYLIPAVESFSRSDLDNCVESSK